MATPLKTITREILGHTFIVIYPIYFTTEHQAKLRMKYQINKYFKKHGQELQMELPL